MTTEQVMSREERMRWCIAQAEEIEATLPPVEDPHMPVEDPHMWDTDRMAAAFWRDLADRVAGFRGMT